jgi:FG-GAP-like repeat
MKSTSHLKWTITPSARGAMRYPPLGRIFLFVAHLLACVALAPVAQALCPPPVARATYVASDSFTANWANTRFAISYGLDVSTSSSFDTYVPGYQNLNVGNVTHRSVTGLNPSTTYYFRVHKYCANKKSSISDPVLVTTLSPTGRPVAITDPATYIASDSATLNGTVDPHGLTTTVYFQYGPTISYGLTTAIQTKTGDKYQDVAAHISGLAASTTYHFRIIANNSAGTRYGVDQTFTTLSAPGPPVVITSPATNVTSSSATLNGSVDPHGLTTNVHFQYGATTNYGLTTAIQSKTADTPQNVVATIGGLTASITYHFRIVATNSAGTRYGADQTFTTPSPFDFNGDGKTDYVLQNVSTRQTALWYLNNNTFLGGASGPTIPAGWSLVDVADFNGDGKPDYALFNPTTRQTAIWYMNNNALIGGADGPTLPSGWSLVATGDFNNDSKPDYVLYNASTRHTAIWYLNNNVFASGVVGPTLPAGWSLVGVADFNGDGQTDYLLFNASTRQSAIWYLSGVTFAGGLFGPTIASGYQLIGTADFNGDGKPDYLLYNASTRQTALWYMHNNVFAGGLLGPTPPVGWSLAAP